MFINLFQCFNIILTNCFIYNCIKTCKSSREKLHWNAKLLVSKSFQISPKRFISCVTKNKIKREKKRFNSSTQSQCCRWLSQQPALCNDMAHVSSLAHATTDAENVTNWLRVCNQHKPETNGWQILALTQYRQYSSCWHNKKWQNIENGTNNLIETTV